MCNMIVEGLGNLQCGRTMERTDPSNLRPKGLYYSNFKKHNEVTHVLDGQSEVINTVKGNLTYFNQRQVKAAADSR